MSGAHAYYLLPPSHQMAVAQLAFGAAKYERRKAIFANLPGFLKKYAIDGFFSATTARVARETGELLALQRRDDALGLGPSGWSQAGRPHRSAKFKQMLSDFRATYDAVKLPPNPMPSMSDPMIFSRDRCFYPSLLDIGGSVVLSWPYDEDKRDAPGDLPEGVTEANRISRAKFMAMIEEYNAQIREEKVAK